MSSPLPSLVFDTAQMEPGAGFRRWAELAHYDVSLPPGKTPQDFHAQMRAWRLNEMLVNVGFIGGLHLTRDQARIARDRSDSLSLVLVKQGDWWADFDGDLREVPRGEVCLLDFARPHISQFSDCESILVTLPRGALMPPHADLALHGHSFSGPSGRMLADHFRSLEQFLPHASLEDAPAISRATLALIQACLPGKDLAVSPLTNLRQRIRRYIDENLTDRMLSPERIASRLSLTRSTLYRSMPPPGVSAYIQNRRLEAALAMLANREERRSLADIAEYFCFASHAHFSTAFRRYFGFSPSQARSGTSASRGGRTDDISEFHAWRRALEAAETLDALKN